MRWIAGLALLAGCTTAPVDIYGPDGRPALLVECTYSVARCHAAARERCAGAYTSIDEKGTANVIGSGGVVSTQQRYALTFRCGGG
jgi:hypothetical protein